MRLTRAVVSTFLTVALLLSPAAAAAEPLGVVLQAQGANLRSAQALAGATVFAGDTLSTTPGGSVRLRLSGAQVYLGSDSTVGLAEENTWRVAFLHRGTVGFATTGDEHVVVRALEVQIYPATTQPTHAEVSVVSRSELLVTSFTGPLEVMVGKEVYPVPEASAYRVLLEPEPQEIEGVGANVAHRARVIGVIAGVTIAAAVITLVLLKNAISPSIP